jgi:hypothetical protein
MELALNVAWLFLALFMVWAWVKYAPRQGADRRMQFVALALVILILLPAISMTDDLMAASNPAEIETCARRDHDWGHPHTLLPVTAALVVAFFHGFSLETVRVAAAHPLPTLVPNKPLLKSLETRPPPAA